MDFENLNAIFKKTDKGIEALKVRDPSLPQKSRVLLILIDGKKTLKELTPLLTLGSDSLERVKELVDAGFACEVMQLPQAKTDSAATKSNATDTQTKFTDDAKSLQIAIRSAIKLLTDLLGPNSDPLCLQLEKCKTKDEFNTKILAFRKIVGTMRSEKLGDEFVKAAIF